MVEYGLIATRSAEFLTGILGQMQSLLDAVPFGSPVAVGVGVAVMCYLLLRKR